MHSCENGQKLSTVDQGDFCTWELLGGTEERINGRSDRSLFNQNKMDAPVILPVQKDSFSAGKVTSNSYESKAKARACQHILQVF